MSTVKKMNQCYAYLCEKEGFALFNGNNFCFDHLRMCMNIDTKQVEQMYNKLNPPVLDEDPNYKPCEHCSA